ncbi:MAG: PH domain-containing protein [Thermomicrobiales bacterium]
MAFCPDCGTENDDNARFCKSCGRQMADVADARAVMDPPVGVAQSDDEGRMIADDGLPVGEDLDGESGGERLLWRGRPSKVFSPLKALTNRYKLSNERLMFEHGFISRWTEEIDLYRVHDVSVRQNIIERIFGFGDITLETGDATAPVAKLINVVDPDRVKDLVRQATRIERQRRRVLVREEF